MFYELAFSVRTRKKEMSLEKKEDIPIMASTSCIMVPPTTWLPSSQLYTLLVELSLGVSPSYSYQSQSFIQPSNMNISDLPMQYFRLTVEAIRHTYQAKYPLPQTAFAEQSHRPIFVVQLQACISTGSLEWG